MDPRLREDDVGYAIAMYEKVEAGTTRSEFVVAASVRT